MAEKESTLIIELASLECNKCYTKIQKVVCKFPDREKISNVNLDTQKNTVTISGSFDTTALSSKLWCKARKAIKSIKIAAEEKKPDDQEPEKDEKKKKKNNKKKKDQKPEPEREPEPTTVNLQLMQMCSLCYPWPCNEPSHYWGPGHLQHPQYYSFPTPCRPAPAAPRPKRPPSAHCACGGQPYCGGACAHGSGWPPAMQQQQQQPAAMACRGGGCRGCNGCRIVQEGRLIYEEYPPSGANTASCTVM